MEKKSAVSWSEWSAGLRWQNGKEKENICKPLIHKM
jgi:hypothetical protein